jgi:hypothetical protein
MESDNFMEKQIELLKVISWNENIPVGTEVCLITDSANVIETKTTSGAQLSSSGKAVIFLERVKGYYILSRAVPRVLKEIEIKGQADGE